MYRVDVAFSQSRGEFDLSAGDREVEQVAEISEPMTEMIHVIGKSYHIT